MTPWLIIFLAYEIKFIIWRRNSTFCTCLRRMTLCCYAALLCYVAKPEVVHALRWKIRFSRTWDKKIPPEEGFLLFLSGTARACLVPRVAFWYRLSGTPFCSFTSVTMTSQRKAQRFPRRQRAPVTLKRTLLACFSLKCISQRGTRKIIKSQCWIQTDNSQSRVIRCHIPVSATASTGICDIVSPSTEICQSGSNTGTWFYYSMHW